MRKITSIFLKVEDRSRLYFERFPFLHAFLAGIGIVLFWRGVWEYSDVLGLRPFWSIVLGALVLLIIGLFLQTFVGNTIIIKKVESEKRAEQKTKTDIKQVEEKVGVEEITLEHLAKKLESIESKIEKIFPSNK